MIFIHLNFNLLTFSSCRIMIILDQMYQYCRNPACMIGPFLVDYSISPVRINFDVTLILHFCISNLYHPTVFEISEIIENADSLLFAFILFFLASRAVGYRNKIYPVFSGTWKIYKLIGAG